MPPKPTRRHPNTPPPLRPPANAVVPPVKPAATPSATPTPVKVVPRHHRIRWTVLTLAALVLIVLVTGGWLLYRAIAVVNTRTADGSRLGFFQQLTHLVSSGDQQLRGEGEDRINILLLGYGGPGHDGPYLTDTMMVASFQPSTKQLALLSIPRDLVVDIPGYDYRKINNVLSFGRDQQYPGGGEMLVVKVVSDTLNIPIQYYARIDFTGFKEVIDRVGGVTVTVDRAFRDSQYPDSGIGYDPITFTAGSQTMNGDRALKFARSRHGNNGEGSDFARAARQQKIIVALKDKLLSFGTLSNPKKISDILGSLGSHSQTNMEIWEMLRLAKLGGDLQADQIVNRVLDDSTDGLLRAATGSGGAFILVPRDSTFRDVQFLAQYIFLAGKAGKEPAKIMVINGSAQANLAQSAAHALGALGLEVVKTANLSGKKSPQTVVVTNRPGQHAATEQLIALFRRAVGTLALADWQAQTGDTTLANALETAITTNVNRTVITNGQSKNVNGTESVFPDLVLVLGEDQPKPGAASTKYEITSTNTANTNVKASNTNTKSTNTNTKTTNTNVTNTNTGTNTNTANTNSSTNTNASADETNSNTNS